MFTDLEKEGYACGAMVLRADPFGADHERKRLYWFAHSGESRRERFKPQERVSRIQGEALSEPVNPLTIGRRAVAGNFSDLLPCDGLSLQLERDAIKGYGNAIVPQVAAAFIEACEAGEEIGPDIGSGVGGLSAPMEVEFD